MTWWQRLGMVDHRRAHLLRFGQLCANGSALGPSFGFHYDAG